MTKTIEKTYREMLLEDSEILEAKKCMKEEGGINQPEDDDKKDDEKKEVKEGKKSIKEMGDIIDDDDEELEEGNEAELNSKLKKGLNKLKDSNKSKDAIKKQGNVKDISNTPESITMKESLETQSNESTALMNSLLESQDLNADHKLQVSALFETAINERTQIIQESLEEKYDIQLQESLEIYENTLADSLNGYLDKVVNEWLEENRLAVESGIKSELSESFLTSMKAVFDDHYVDIPDEKMDIVENVIHENEELEASLNSEMKARMIAESELVTFHKKDVIENMSTGLTLTEKERLLDLAEDVEYKDAETFGKKVLTIKENFIKKNEDDTSEILNESRYDKQTTASKDPIAEKYGDMVSRMSSDNFNIN